MSLHIHILSSKVIMLSFKVHMLSSNTTMLSSDITYDAILGHRAVIFRVDTYIYIYIYKGHLF